MHGAVQSHILLQLLKINLITDFLPLYIHFLSQNQNRGCTNWIEDSHTLLGIVATNWLLLHAFLEYHGMLQRRATLLAL
jgi:hypothetical protein